MASGTAIITYIIKKHTKTKTNRCNISITLHSEIKKLIGVVELNEKINPNKRQRQRIPNMEIYQGLLNSGNIKYLDNNLQDKLNDMYANFKESSLDSDVDLDTDIRYDLKK